MTITAPGQSTNKNLDQNLSNLLTDDINQSNQYYINEINMHQNQHDSMLQVCFPLQGNCFQIFKFF